MIYHNGYYITEPQPYQERKEWTTSYLSLAYLFKADGTVIKHSKWSENEQMETFQESDFKGDIEVNKYFIVNEEELYMLGYENQPWETKFYYDIVSNNELIDRQTGKSIKFVPFKTGK